MDPFQEHRWRIRPIAGRYLELLCDGRVIAFRPALNADAIPALVGIAAALGAGGYDQ